MGSYFAVVTCRNSENIIEQAITSLKNQTIKPEYVIVVDDGSTDRTPEILKRIQSQWTELHIITNPDLGYNLARIVSNWNRAMTYAKEEKMRDTDYHMIATDDTIYEKDYAEKIVRYMDLDTEIVVASGNYGNQKSSTPHGAGRFVRNSFFYRVFSLYPEKMGYESLILYSSMQHGHTCKVFTDARFVHTRPLGRNHHFYEFGASMRTLGYHPVFVLGRFFLCFVTGNPLGRSGAIRMLYHYLTYKAKAFGYDSMHDEDIRGYIRKKQLQMVRDKLKV